MFCGDIPDVGPDLSVCGQTVQHDAVAGVSTGTVHSGDRLVATVIERIAFIDVAPRPAVMAGSVGDLEGSTLGCLGGVMTEAGVQVRVGENATNPGGALHGGVSVYLTELAASHVVHEQNPDLVPATLHISYARPGRFGETIEFVAESHHLGRNSATIDVAASDTSGRVVTRARLTYHRR